ncbi:lytic transglycosylase domain-containing protein [Microvirga sp. VF16]|uniref:lytic transglycosylase domain-containing protein n=1 Tax=Microvirga sp. VF16 TaxID=2807101 RepID=UPI00193DD93B|nr:lytic transglycosylase domain-containing protein [Microvirga sp. VF16]QRM30826.1 lytic transglycosylase domain-containing protein [Microvirga sp. VF16]
MTWQHLLRTLAIAFLGAAALILAAEARAEGGNADNVISPDKAEEFLNAAAAEAAAVAEEETAAAAESEKPAKAAKGSDKKKPKDNSIAAKTDKAQDGKSQSKNVVKAAAPSDDEEAGNQTASLPSTPMDARLKLRQSDAVRGSAIKPLIVRYASENGLPYELADAVIRLESRYNASARNGPNMGLTQINVRTAQSLGYQGPATGLLDAETNLRYGLKYLAKAYKLAGGDTCGTILRYQFGHRTQAMTGASRAYCAKVKVLTAAAD